jgi:hypothetical protein
MYIIDSATYTELESGTRAQGGGWALEWLLQQDRIPAEPSPAIRRCAGTAVCEVDPLDLVETIREGVLVLDPDWTVRFVPRSFGEPPQGDPSR